jgi:hypothetical protein
MREDDAKKLWCPMRRLTEMDGYNRCGPSATLYCIGSACAMWRGRIRCDTHAVTGEQDSYEDGYCGLAGKP